MKATVENFFHQAFIIAYQGFYVNMEFQVF
jgi:hypothetical protein